MSKRTLDHIKHYLANCELDLNDLISGRLRTNRKLCMAIINHKLARVRSDIFEYKSYWDYDVVKKLEELENALATLETSEKNNAHRKPHHFMPQAILG
jgi:hypothetical protein